MRKTLALAALALLASAPVHAAPASDWRAQLSVFVKAHLRHPAWGWQHSLRDYQVARDCARTDGVALDDDVLFAAAELHDLAGFQPWADPDPAHDHSDVGADKLGAVLLPMGFPAEKLDAVRAATRTHMYYRKAIAPEAVYLHDADALDWLGAIGVARIIATVEHGDPPAAKPDAYSAPDLPGAIALIEQNLKDAPAGLQSAAARARAPALIAEARAFLARLKAESDDGKAL